MVVGAGEGRLLASLGQSQPFFATTSCAYPQSHAVGTDQCAIFRIVATDIDYFSLLVTACPRLFTYHCLSSTIYLPLPGAYPRWNERASSRTIRWKERASSQSRKHVFHPDEFLRSRVTGQSTSGSACMRLPFLSCMHAHTDKTNCKYRAHTLCSVLPACPNIPSKNLLFNTLVD